MLRWTGTKNAENQESVRGGPNNDLPNESTVEEDPLPYWPQYEPESAQSDSWRRGRACCSCPPRTHPERPHHDGPVLDCPGHRPVHRRGLLLARGGEAPPAWQGALLRSRPIAGGGQEEPGVRADRSRSSCFSGALEGQGGGGGGGGGGGCRRRQCRTDLDAAVIFVCNHSNQFLDPGVLVATVGRPISFLIADVSMKVHARARARVLGLRGTSAAFHRALGAHAELHPGCAPSGSALLVSLGAAP